MTTLSLKNVRVTSKFLQVTSALAVAGGATFKGTAGPVCFEGRRAG